MDDVQIKARLMELIHEIPADQQRDLLKLLEWGRRDQRRHSRKASRRPATLSVRGRRHPGIARNISDGGVFIETPASVAIGQEVFLIVSLFSFEDPLTIKGRVVRVEPTGIAVQFDEVLRDLFKDPEKEFHRLRKESRR